MPHFRIHFMKFSTIYYIHEIKKQSAAALYVSYLYPNTLVQPVQPTNIFEFRTIKKIPRPEVILRFHKVLF